MTSTVFSRVLRNSTPRLIICQSGHLKKTNMDIKAKENVKERNEIKSFLSCSVLVLFFNEDRYKSA